MERVVIGAGLSGLVIARALRCPCLEARAAAGGRIRTVYEADGRTAYESGPWRVPSTHRRVLQLCHSLSIPLEEGSVPPALKRRRAPRNRMERGLSEWDLHALAQESPVAADVVDLESGYADQTHCAAGSTPYTADTERFFVAPGGFTQIVDRLSRAVDVRYDHRVCDVVREGDHYRLELARRVGHNSFVTEHVRAKAIFVCVPPSLCQEWNMFRRHARSVLNAVEPGPLHHIYVKSSHPLRKHTVDPGSLCAQCIPSQYANRWFQASYSAGRVATFWHNLSLASPLRFWRLLRDSLQRMIGPVAPFAEVRSHFWPAALHTWRAVPNFQLARAVRAATQPNPVELPSVYLAGEAFSSYQAWMEGALETAELAIAAHRASTPGDRGGGEEDHVRVEGHRVAVGDWAKVHPGGASAIRNHLGEEVSSLMKHMGHSAHAWAVVHSLKIA